MLLLKIVDKLVWIMNFVAAIAFITVRLWHILK